MEILKNNDSYILIKRKEDGVETVVKNMGQIDVAVNICTLIKALQDEGHMDKDVISLMSDLLTKSDKELEEEVLNLLSKRINDLTNNKKTKKEKNK